ncbi:50S ribosomal protein L15 [Desulfuromonas thiophila]|jgi:large subunit ribosomal protein L15|uniref:Large ribosomal subunit protein uL15 n=1 Tax=Desulfuromonas thiophila TaxID=57664 RepID=A0A1G6YRI6_9BACT|nr:50S ribosomal protein L15 [Desulfuromonas thiophila]MCK9172109.1 50S ribosomal protein L15 [Desulfuromonas thiophila]MDD3800904.1 50S ribosomal protein L15 [Desulfuromonas thiophila]MDY0397347.1 50S ribosomal protein L15 [Desulfuromonas thiophila]SDD92901.1 LSU ribosomal protein L15P [Desulfuromonas thiophila]
MDLSNLSPAAGSVKKRKRIGRGPGSGNGKTAGKGHKGQNARSGGGVKPGFEGGQMPLQRRLPKRGFTPLDKKVYALVNLRDLDTFEAGSVVDPQQLIAAGLVRQIGDGVKVLGDGELTKAVTVKAHRFSRSAQEKIAAAGGTVEVL